MHPRQTPLVALVLLVLAALACNVPGQGGAPTATPDLPVVSIIAPASGITVNVNQRVEIRSVSSDTRGGVTKVELRVDGAAVNTTEPLEGPQIAWTVQQEWTPQTAGAHTVEVVAYRGTVASLPASITITAQGSSASLTPTSATGPATCTATTTTSLNFRTGPATNYPRIYVLQEGTTLAIIGRLGDNSWWQVRSTDGLIGWVSAEYTDEQGNCSGVPVAAPPPSPTPAPPPTASGVSQPPTPAPMPNLQIANIEGPAQVILPSGGGLAVTFVVTVLNAGGAASGQFTVKFYPHGRADAGVTPLEVAAAPLAGASTLVVTFQHIYTAPGIYIAEAQADGAGQVAELDEGDNLRTFTIQVFPAGYGG